MGIEPTVPLPGQQFSRLPDSATLAPLRMAGLIVRQGRVGTNVSSLRSAVEGAYPGECEFSIGFLRQGPLRPCCIEIVVSTHTRSEYWIFGSGYQFDSDSGYGPIAGLE